MVFTIGQVADDFGVSVATLKRWEAEGIIPRAKRKHLTRWRVWDYDDAQKIGKFIGSKRSENENRV